MEFMKRFKIRLQGGGDGHCAPRKEESSGRLVKSISSVIKQRVPVKCVEYYSVHVTSICILALPLREFGTRPIYWRVVQLRIHPPAPTSTRGLSVTILNVISNTGGRMIENAYIVREERRRQERLRHCWQII